MNIYRLILTTLQQMLMGTSGSLPRTDVRFSILW